MVDISKNFIEQTQKVIEKDGASEGFLFFAVGSEEINVHSEMDLKTFITAMAAWLNDPGHIRERMAIREILNVIEGTENNDESN